MNYVSWPEYLLILTVAGFLMSVASISIIVLLVLRSNRRWRNMDEAVAGFFAGVQASHDERRSSEADQRRLRKSSSAKT